MRNAMTIAGREIRSSFVTPLAYAVAAGFVVLSGFFFFSLLQQFNTIVMQSAMSPDMNPSLNQWVVTPFYQTLEVVLVFLIPILTMRSFADEKRSGTFELLVTSPITIGALVLGKLLGMLVIVFLILGLAFVFPCSLMFFASPEVPPILIGFFGLCMFSASYCALGIAVSACTKNQTIAGVISVVLALVLYVIDAPAEKIGGVTGEILTYLAPATHTQLLTKGVLSGVDIVYFASLLLLGLFMANRVLEAQRWR